MKYWLITDTHFGHKKMIEYCGRPAGFESMILKNLLQVQPQDILIHLGDFCIGADERWHQLFNSHCAAFKKWLVKGNHDSKSDKWYLEHGWDFVGEEIQLNRFGFNIQFTHRPQNPPAGMVNVHGHLHNTSHHATVEAEWLLEIDTTLAPINLEKFLNERMLLDLNSHS